VALMIDTMSLPDAPVHIPIDPVTCSLSLLVRRLEALIGSDRWTLQKVGTGDYEVRTYRGEVGRGMTATDALSDLVEKLGSVTYA
jgi:hypothetical protein